MKIIIKYIIYFLIIIPNDISACRLWCVVSYDNYLMSENNYSFQIIQSQANYFQSLGSGYPNGWSLCSYNIENELSSLFRSELHVDTDTMYQAIFDSLVHLPDTSVIILGHLRAASSGAVDIPNPHPFTFNHDNKIFSLIHNGTLNKDILFDLITENGSDSTWILDNPPSTYNQYPWYSDSGWINVVDSELYLLWIMKNIIEEEDLIDEGDIDLVNKKKYDKYKLPSSTLLNSPVENQVSQSDDELKEKATQLIHALETFGVQGEVIRISPGPVITLFEIEPAEGVRVNKFVTLSDDLARVMQAQRIRVIAPIPGSRSVGVELPNDKPQMVFLQTILNSEKFINSDSKLTIAIGKTTTGDAFTFDLNKLPHLLIAGATGAGKSVCINTIIMSILYKAKPDEVKFILIDPKKLELSTYKKLVGYHLTTAPNLDEYVMTTADNAVGILDASIHEMERRFSLFADVGVRNIEEYHSRSSLDNAMEKIPYLVILIDELADLMMTSAKAIEDPITRLAQKARAVGLHLVVATQRPSVDVITGLIKSNFPARLSFQVSQRVDSRTILDQMGAEKLLGKGDLLFLKPGSSSPIRLHNAFITLDEIEKVLSHINEQPKPNEIKLPEAQTISQTKDSTTLDSEHDELLYEAAKLVVDVGQASVSLLQRRFRIGYSRAGRLIDELESLGIVSGHSGSKAREVLVDLSYIKNIFENL